MGYYEGDPDRIMDAPAETIIDIINFENFDQDFQMAFHEMNKENS